MAANRRALLREKIEAVVTTVYSVIPITPEEPTDNRPSAWVQISGRDVTERDASGESHVWRQEFMVLVFTQSVEQTEAAATEVIDEAIDAIIVAIEDSMEFYGSEVTDAGDTLNFSGASAPSERVAVDGSTGRASALIQGWIEYSQ